MREEKSCGAVIIKCFDTKYKVLLINHVNGGHWSFPKGHMKGNETESETALREINEETGLKVNLDTRFRHLNTYFPKENTIKDVIYFLAFSEESALTAQSEEINEANWYTFEEALEKITYGNDIMLLKTAKKYINKNYLGYEF